MKIVEDKAEANAKSKDKRLTILAVAVGVVAIVAIALAIWANSGAKPVINDYPVDTDNKLAENLKADDKKISKVLEDAGIEVKDEQELEEKVAEINDDVISVYNDPNYLDMGMDLDAIKKDIIAQLVRKNQFIKDKKLGWSSNYGYDEDLFHGAYLYNEALVDMMKTGTMEIANNQTYSLEKQAAKIRYSVFMETQFKTNEQSSEFYDCLYHWFEQGHFELKSIDSILLQFVEDGPMFDERYYVNVQATIISEGEKYVAYLCPRSSDSGRKEWTVLDIMKEG